MLAVREWALEEPYSRHPWLVGSSISCGIGRFGEAETLAKQGLLANPRDFLLNNNVAYALLKNSSVEDAENVLKTAPPPQTPTERSINLATRGLLEFKKGAIPRGRELYLEAVEGFEKIDDPRLVALAFLNLAIAEVEAGGERAVEFVSQGMAATKNCESPDLTLTIRQLQEVIQKKLLGVLREGEGGKKIRELAALVDTTEGKKSRTTKTNLRKAKRTS